MASHGLFACEETGRIDPSSGREFCSQNCKLVHAIPRSRLKMRAPRDAVEASFECVTRLSPAQPILGPLPNLSSHLFDSSHLLLSWFRARIDIVD
jgi:hypothetical protein